MRIRVVSLLAAAFLGLSAAGSAGWQTVASAASASAPPLHHVFVITLENESASSTFESTDPYLGKGGTLQQLGLYLPNYYGIGHVSNDNYLAMISGQAPNLQTNTDCQLYTSWIGTGALLAPGTTSLATPLDGQAVGTGCVYPSSVQTLPNQLDGAGYSWKGYMEDMGNDPTRESATCGHPKLNSVDKTQTAEAPGPNNNNLGDGYATRHDPFMYFSSIIGNPSYCNSHVVPLGSPTGALPAGTPTGTTGLATDLQSISTTPNFSFITPNLCNDGHDFPCTNDPAESTQNGSAVGDIDSFLKTWVPLITNSPAFKQDGLLVVTWDEGAFPGDSSSCCNELPGPLSPLPGLTGLGGGRVGAVLISPDITPNTTTSSSYNHYGLLGSLEDLFGVGRLGFAADVPSTFGCDVYNAYSGCGG